MKTKLKKMKKIIYTLLTISLITSCATDKHKIEGAIINVRGEYFRIDNRMGNSYILEPIKFDSTTFVLEAKQ